MPRPPRKSLPKAASLNCEASIDPLSDDMNITQDEQLGRPVVRETLVGVVIPTTDMSTFQRPARKTAKSATSSTNSPATASRDGSSEYDTPATSVATTPAASIVSRKPPASRASAPRAKAAMKRKLETVDLSEDDTTGDAQLAQAMQEEEYAMPEPKRAKYTTILDSDDDDIMLSDPGESSEDVALSTLSKRKSIGASKTKVKKITKPVKKAIDSRPKKALPKKRAAAASAKLAIAAAPIIADSDDSALSDFVASDDEGGKDETPVHFDGESLDEDDDDDDDVGDTTAAGPETTRFGRRRRQIKMDRASRERAKLEKAHPEIKTMWDTLKAVPKIKMEPCEQPQSLTLTLKSYQLEGVNWMKKQEQTQWRGGLLGDEMGMGKTIQTVALIMSDYPAKKPTLVVVPPVALMQWSNEIKAYTNGKLKVLVYHGTNSKAKGLSVKELMKFDIIMISYPGLESVYRKETKGWSRGEKIVKEDSAIHSIDFHRLILDEAHSIKSRTSGVAKACFALKSDFKWCLSGTPVQNRIGEFFSLLRFLEVKPFANYFCKSCPCSALHWSVSSDYRCTLCSHRALDHVSVFNQEILNPITTPAETDEKRKGALAKLRMLTDRIMLRRVKRDYTASMELPPKEIIIHNEFFGEIERDFSTSIMSNTARQFDTYVSRGVMLNNYANIFGLIMQMRQVADHPDLLLKKHAEGGQNVLVCNICDEPAEDAIKSRCKHEFCRACVKDYVRTCEASGAVPDCPRCHIALAVDFDQPEIEQDEEGVKSSSIINRIKMEMLVYDLYKLRSKKQTLKSIVFSQFTSMLQLIEWRLRRAGFKTVMLDGELISIYFFNHTTNATPGSMTPAQRQKSIEYFMTNTDVEVFLVSLKAGGVALNLTEASRVFIVDPWWNPAAEWQSADRCHRIGQRRPCVITRLCIEDSVESRIVALRKSSLVSTHQV
jgi:DNA repair protein RAD16